MAIKQSYIFSNGVYFTHFWGTFTPSRMGASKSSSHSFTPSAAKEACAVLQLFLSAAVNSSIVVDLRDADRSFPRDLPLLTAVSHSNQSPEPAVRGSPSPPLRSRRPREASAARARGSTACFSFDLVARAQ